MFSQIESEGFVLVEHKPNWVNESDYALIAPYAEKLYRFYVLENPVDRLSAHCVGLAERGWESPWKYPEHLNRKIKDASNSAHLFFSAARLEDVEDALKRAGLLEAHEIPEYETACFFNSERNQVMSCFCHIRNSFCHGRFKAFARNGEPWLALEDKSTQGVKGKDGKKLSARMVLRLSTLLQWIDIVEGGPERSSE